jgi:hypothetical protein
MSNVVYWLRDASCGSPLDSGYIGVTHRFGRRVHEHRKRSRLPPFEAHILFVGSRQECLNVERIYRPHSKIGWNNASGGIHGFLHSVESRAKIGKASTGKAYCLGRELNEEHKRKIGDALRGRKRGPDSPERIEKNRLAHLGQQSSEETRAKIGAALRGRTRPAEIGVKIGAKLKGRKVNNDHLRGNKFWAGRKHSEETKRKLSAAARNRPARVWSDAERAKLSATMKVVAKGRKIPDEIRKKASDVLRGRVVPEETRRKIGASLSGRKRPLIVRMKISSSHKRRARVNAGDERQLALPI